MSTLGIPSINHLGDRLASLNPITLTHEQPARMCVERGQPLPMVDHNRPSVPAHPRRLHDRPTGSGSNYLAAYAIDINASVVLCDDSVVSKAECFRIARALEHSQYELMTPQRYR